jgi:TolB-like protein
MAETGFEDTETGSIVRDKPAIAVLPLAFQSDDLSREYFADRLTQDIIKALDRFSALTAISWNAVFPYKEKAAPS